MKKVAMGLKETFLSKSFDEIEQRRTFYEIDRGMSLIKEYANEINYLLHSEEVVTSHRGNEIFKALTISRRFYADDGFRRLWGMNFEVMPELSLKYGYFIFAYFNRRFDRPCVLVFEKERVDRRFIEG
jgi:Mg2+ and Co2+ transporter CorA